MNNNCSVSIVVPVCNVQKYLRQCLDSLTDQTLQDIQIICIDDGSTDDSLSILQEYGSRDSRIEIISKPNAGYGHTMNMGFAAAKGEYVGIVESDDFAEVDMFEKMYNLAKSNDADVVIRNIFPAVTKGTPRAGGFEYSLPGSDKIVGRTGTGFDHKTLVDMLNNPNSYIGQLAKIKTRGQFKSGAYRAPSFISLRVD